MNIINRNMDLDEVYHVLDSHTIEGRNIMRDEYDCYTKTELLEVILQTNKQLDDFLNRWLDPVLNELEEYRTKAFLENNELV